MNWSPGQDMALRRVSDWLLDRTTPFFYLAGFAGTGKTTLARHFAEGVSGRTHFGAYTGKAAAVMRTAGCWGARTLHSLIYVPSSKSREHLKGLEAEETILKQEQQTLTSHDPRMLEIDTKLITLAGEIEAERANLTRPAFTLNLESDLRGASLLIVDECSMVDRQMGEDILSFGVPVLVLGDPAQLPPVFGTGFFTNNRPDVLLTEVHRQALDSPVLRIATMVREGNTNVPHGDYGNGTRITADRLNPEEVLAAEQILVGRNATRRASNVRVRELRGLKEFPFPRKGERLVCLRNNRELGLFNGAMYVCEEDGEEVTGYVNLWVRPEEGGETVHVSAHREHFLGQELPNDWGKLDAEEFTYGSALTVHKAQGSQWKTTVLFDEWYQTFRKEHVYTGLTRASDSCIWVRR